MPKQRVLYSLDIGSSSIKILKVAINKTNIEILDAFVYNLPTEIAELDNLEDKLIIWKEAIDHIFNTEKIASHTIINITVPSEFAIVRYNNLPNIPLSKINNLIQYEVEQQIPIPIDELEWDYDICSNSSSKELNVVIAATNKKIIAFFQAIFIEKKFQINSFEVPQLMLINASKYFNAMNGNEIIIDLGASATSVVLINGDMEWSRSFKIGQSDITVKIASKLNISFKEAEHLKKNFMQKASIVDNLSTEVDFKFKIVLEAVIEIFDEIIDELGKTISFYLSSNRGAVFEKIILTGGGSFIVGVEEYFRRGLGLEVLKGNFIDGVYLHSSIRDRMNYDGNLYQIALGNIAEYIIPNALSTNLIGLQVKNQHRINAYKRNFVFFAFVSLIALGLLLGNFVLEVNIKSKQQVIINNYLDKIKLKESQLRKLEKGIEKKTALLEKVKNLIAVKNTKPSFLNKLSEIMPEDLWLDSLYIEGNKGYLVGKTKAELSGINNFKRALSDLKEVDTVKIVSASVGEIADHSENLRNFKIEIKLVNTDIGGVQN